MKKKGVGIALYTLPTGMKGGGDPSQATVKLNPDGTFTVLVGTVDIGQGSSTTLRQVAADCLDVDIEQVTLSNHSDYQTLMCLGSFASRVSTVDPNAVLFAVNHLKEQMKEFVVHQMEVDPDNLEIADGKIFVKDDSEKSMTMADVGAAVNWGGHIMIGTAAWMIGPASGHDPEDGKMTAVGAMSWTAAVVELEVDTGTGEVTLLKVVHANEVGRALNPMLVKGQVYGSMAMGIGTALTEDTDPYYPTRDFHSTGLGDYLIPTAADMPLENEVAILEMPNPNLPIGSKGFSGELGAAPAAIMNAIYDALRLWVTDYPATPERILRAPEAAEPPL